VLLVGMVGFLVLPLYIPLRHAWHTIASFSPASLLSRGAAAGGVCQGAQRLRQWGGVTGRGGGRGGRGEVGSEEGEEEEDEFDLDASEGTTRQFLSRSESYDSLFSELSTVNSISDFQALLPPPSSSSSRRAAGSTGGGGGGG